MEKGQRVYIASDDKRNSDYEGTITSIGKKYITVTDDYGHKTRFHIDTLYREDWCVYRLYESKEKCIAETKRYDLSIELWRKFDRNRGIISYEDLLSINEILGKY